MTKAWQPYALHILDAIAKIRRIEARGDIRCDDILYDAALRNLQTLSEATQRLPEGLKAAFGNVPWREISGFRNILVHDYLGTIDAEVVAQVIDERLHELEAAVTTMLAKA
ncbi:MAG: DUF86 domain-containing protein [Betaproteobacteria bacterium]|nr:MAG: DUF86 domain-containing protein [Betaproteobacteria bacterium]